MRAIRSTWKSRRLLIVRLQVRVLRTAHDSLMCLSLSADVAEARVMSCSSGRSALEQAREAKLAGAGR